VIEIAGLRKSYAGRTVLDGIDLTVAPGQLVALLGPNGAGKTTTVEIVEGYRDADAGSVRVLGVEPRGAATSLKARVGLMLQGGAGVEPRATPRDLLALYGALHDGARRASELIDLVGLGAAAGTRVRRLSGGERQRLALAIALVGDPEVLILDEPTAGMDPEARRATRDLVASLRDEGRTILMTTHDLGDAEHLADQVAILHRGRIVAEGSPDELTTGGSTAIRFRLHAPPPPAALETLAGRLRGRDRGVELRASGAVGTAFEVGPGAASADVVADIASWAARHGLLIVELRSGAASLEERYLELTGDADVEDVT
jgi:ABC-2 type transport system ATP-binding protein